MKDLAIYFSMSLNKIWVTEIERQSWQLWRFATLGTDVTELVHFRYRRDGIGPL